MSAAASPGFLAKTWALARKDLTVEIRGRDTLLPMLVFALTVTSLVGLALPEAAGPRAPVRVGAGTVPLADVIAGFLWITVLFAGLIGFARAFEIEREEGAIDALLLVPVDRSGLFLAKALANFAAIAALEAVTVPLFALVFGLRLGAGWAGVVLVIVLVDVGFVSIGTLMATLAAQTRSRELLLPILALPALVPVFVAATELSSDLFMGEDLGGIASRGWFAILLAFDAIAAVVGALAFEYVLE